MDFSYPAEVDQFRKELRAWLTEHLTDEVMRAGRVRGERCPGHGNMAAAERRCSNRWRTRKRPPYCVHRCR